MQLNPSFFSSLPEAASGIEDDEAARVERLIARMTEAKKMLNGLLANLARLETSMAVHEPADPIH